MPYSNVANVIFTVRNADKTTSGDIGRGPVTVGQAGALVKSITQLDNPLSKALSKGLEVAKSDAVASKIGKVVKFASDNVNPLIVASSGLKVALADEKDRKQTLFSESGCIAGMFIGEGLMKSHLDKVIAHSSIGPKWTPIVKGIVFVTGSITASTIGQKIGEFIGKYWNKPLTKQEEKQIVQREIKENRSGLLQKA